MSLYSDIIRNLQTTFTNELPSYTIYLDDDIPTNPADKFINIKFQIIDEFKQRTMRESNTQASFEQPLLVSFEIKQKIETGTGTVYRLDAIYDIQELLNNRALFQDELSLIGQYAIFEAKSETSISDLYNMAVVEAHFSIRTRRTITL